MKPLVLDGRPGWLCEKCGGVIVDELAEPGPKPADDFTGNETRGCVAIVGMILLFMGWIAYLLFR